MIEQQFGWSDGFGVARMLQEIAKILKIKFDSENPEVLMHLRRIERKLPVSINVDLQDRIFIKYVKDAADLVEKCPGPDPIICEPDEASTKIKRSPKGKRLGIKLPDGRMVSFGPIWIEKVAACSKYATNDRCKLELHAKLIGVKKPYPSDGVELCKLINAKMEECGDEAIRGRSSDPTIGELKKVGKALKEGNKGFKFSSSWVMNIKNKTGAPVNPIMLNKLIKYAKIKKVTIDDNMTVMELCDAIAKVL